MSGLRPRPGMRPMVLTPQKIPDFLIPARSPRITWTHRPSNPSHHDGLQGPCQAGLCDVDLSTRAALSLPHVAQVTTPYGFNAVLAASPCTHRRESLYHRRPLSQDPHKHDPTSASPPSSGQIINRSWPLRPIRAIGQEVQFLPSSPAQDPEDFQDLVDQHSPAALSPSAGPGSGRARLLLLGQQLFLGLHRPVIALKARSPSYPDPKPR